MVVVLPAPLAPSRQKISPGSIFRFKGCSAAELLKDFDRLIASSTDPLGQARPGMWTWKSLSDAYSRRKAKNLISG